LRMKNYDGLGFNMKLSTYMNETWIHSLFTVTRVGTTVRHMVLQRTIAVSSGYLLTVVQKWGLFQEHIFLKHRQTAALPQ